MLQTVVTYAPTLFGCFLFVVCCGVGCVCVCDGSDARRTRKEERKGARQFRNTEEKRGRRGGVCASVREKNRNFQEHPRILKKKGTKRGGVRDAEKKYATGQTVPDDK